MKLTAPLSPYWATLLMKSTSLNSFDEDAPLKYNAPPFLKATLSSNVTFSNLFPTIVSASLSVPKHIAPPFTVLATLLMNFTSSKTFDEVSPVTNNAPPLLAVFPAKTTFLKVAPTKLERDHVPTCIAPPSSSSAVLLMKLVFSKVRPEIALLMDSAPAEFLAKFCTNKVLLNKQFSTPLSMFIAPPILGAEPIRLALLL